MKSMTLKPLLWSLCFASLCANPCLAQSGGIEIFSGETLFAEGTRISLSHLYEQRTDLYQGSDTVDNSTDPEFTRSRLILGYTYGLGARFSIGGLLPVVDVEHSDNSGPSTGDTGFGDTTVFGKWRLYTADSPRGSRNLSIVGGIEAPTGQTGSVQPQPGSGSWDPFVAFAFTNSVRRWRFDSVALFKVNGTGTDNRDTGDEFSLGAAMAYRYLHRPYPGASHAARLGLLWQSQGSSSLSGSKVGDTGSERLYLRPALSFHPNPAIDISINVDLPLSQHYSGTQLGDDFRTFFAVGYRF